MFESTVPPPFPAPRQWPRFRVTVPALVEVFENADLMAGAVAGSTRDIGAGGVYVVTQEPVAAGARVRVSADLGRVGQAFRTAGSVVRCEEYGFAVAFDDTLLEAMHLNAAMC